MNEVMNGQTKMFHLLANLMQFRAEGLIKSLGVCNFTLALLRECIEQHQAPIACNQIEYHLLLDQSRAPMAFAAQTGEVPIVAWLLLIVTVLWATAYDTMYAMVDRPDDLKIGVKSTAILFGEADRVIIGIIQLMMLAVLVIIGQQLKLSGFYFMAVMTAGLLMVYQQYLIRHRDSMQCMRAFRNNNWVGAVLFLGLYGHYI